MDFLDTIAVVFALVLIGYGLSWSGVLREGAGEALGDFVFVVAIPVLLFRTLSEADFAGARPLPLYAAYFLAIALTWAASSLAARRLFGRDARGGVVAGLAGSFSNLVLLGIPLILSVFGQQGFETLTLLLAVHLPVMMAASVILFEVAAGRDGAGSPGRGPGALLRGFAAGMARNPIVLGILLGVAWRFGGLSMPAVPAALIERVASVAGTLALIALGMSLRRFGIRRNVAQAGVVAAFKLGLMPLIATAAAWLLALPPAVAHVAIVAAAMPAGVNPFLIASRFGTGEALASNAMVVATLLAPVSIAFWLFAARALF